MTSWLKLGLAITLAVLTGAALVFVTCVWLYLHLKGCSC